MEEGGGKERKIEMYLNATKIHSKMETNQGNEEKAYRANVQTRKRLNALKYAPFSSPPISPFSDFSFCHFCHFLPTQLNNSICEVN